MVATNGHGTVFRILALDHPRRTVGALMCRQGAILDQPKIDGFRAEVLMNVWGDDLMVVKRNSRPSLQPCHRAST